MRDDGNAQRQDGARSRRSYYRGRTPVVSNGFAPLGGAGTGTGQFPGAAAGCCAKKSRGLRTRICSIWSSGTPRSRRPGSTPLWM
jgi:hypothetical protein